MSETLTKKVLTEEDFLKKEYEAYKKFYKGNIPSNSFEEKFIEGFRGTTSIRTCCYKDNKGKLNLGYCLSDSCRAYFAILIHNGRYKNVTKIGILDRLKHEIDLIINMFTGW